MVTSKNEQASLGKEDVKDKSTIDIEEDEADPWELPEISFERKPWTERTTFSKVRYVVWTCFLRYVVLLGLLYMFICSLDFLSSAFRLLGGRAAGEAFSHNEVLKNPVAGLMLGVLVTVLVQSSSTSTSIVIAMVGAGVLTIDAAVFIVMGANIGTTVTNTIVSMGQVAVKDEYRRAFAAATVHDMFNWLTVLVVLPLEAIFGGLFKFTAWLVKVMHIPELDENMEFLKALTSPFTKLIIKVDKDVIKSISKGEDVPESNITTILKRWCDYPHDVTDGNNITTTEGAWERCENLFAQSELGDTLAGVILLIIALVILCLCLIFIVKLLHSILKGGIAKIIRKVINMDLPKVPWLTGYIAILVGAGATVLVQSSSIFTSTLTPLVGVGLIKLDRMYPLTLGSNIGTTATGIMAALVADAKSLQATLQVALVHFFFNIAGILLWYPVPAMRRVPIKAAKFLGNTTAKYRWFAMVYLILMFFVLPGIVFGLSIPGWHVLVAVGIPLVLLVTFVTVVTWFQPRSPGCLPKRLRNWDFLPYWMRSMEPLDRVMRRFLFCKCTQHLKTEAIVGEKESKSSVEEQVGPRHIEEVIENISFNEISRCQDD